MSHLDARPKQTRQPSSASTASTFSSPETQLLTPAYVSDFYGGQPNFREGRRTDSPSARSIASDSDYDHRAPKGLSAVEEVAYVYALRVAALHSHQNPAPPTQSPLSSPIAIAPPNVHRKSFSFRKASPPSSPISPPPVPHLPSLPSSHSSGETKLPKEYLIELWGLLATEPGDAAFLQAKRAFLGGIKKGSRNERGGNLRDIGVLLDTFLSCIPPQTPAHPHQTHFLRLLSTSLPTSAHFSGSSRPQSQKDRELLHRLRREVAGYILEQPVAMTQPASSMRQPDAAPARPAMKANLGDMEETVGLIFGISREILKRDLHEMTEQGSMEELYAAHLKSTLAQLDSLPTQTSAQRNQHSDLSRQLSFHLSNHPHCATATASEPFFTPPRKMEIYSALCDRAELNVTLQQRAQTLINECVRVWTVPGEDEREKEVEGLIIAWTRSVGQSPKEEREWGMLLEDGVGDLSAGHESALGVGMTQLLSALLGLLGRSASGLLGDGSAADGKTSKVKAPPVSLLPLLLSGNGVFLRQESTVRKLEDIRDELKGSAVGEYVQAVEWLMGGIGAGIGGSEQVKGFTEVAERIEAVILDIEAKWGSGLGDAFNPAAIVLSKQLPLFFAELQMMDSKGTIGSDKVFGLYEGTGKLAAMWEEMCPGIEHGFDPDAFFEPYVVAWLKETESSKAHEWVSRAVAMDRWVPESDQKHSQSVVDLFEFIQQTLRVVLQDLPLSPQKRALYLTDMSKTASMATSQYGSTLQALFQVDMNPPKSPNLAGDLGTKLNDKIGGKAGSWLAKGQQAMKGLERKRVEPFVIPPPAMVKLSNIGAASKSLEDLSLAIRPDETSRLVKMAREVATTQPFVLTISRGQNLLSKGQNKGADAFCVATDLLSGDRLIKTRTVLGSEDPRWDQSFDVVVTGPKSVEVAVYDRSLVGKHDLIGSTIVKLDPKVWTTISTRDVQIPLQPRGHLYLRISTEAMTSNDIRATLASATRSLERYENDMIAEVVERMLEFLRDQLGSKVLAEMTKVKDKKRGKVPISEAELVASLSGSFDYLNANFATFASCLEHSTRLTLQLKLWNRLLEHLTSLLVPPLSDRPSTSPPIPAEQVEVVLKWLPLLKSFFNAREGATEHGVKLVMLQAGVYKDIMMVGQYLDLPTPALKERAAAAVKGVVSRGRGLSDDVSSQAEGERMAEVLLRIVRTRPDTADFLQQQVGALSKARIDRHIGII